MNSSVRPPGPRGYPVLGVLPQLRSDPIRTFLDAADRYGDVVHMKAGPYHGYLLSDPADIRHVLQDNARNYHKSPLYERLKHCAIPVAPVSVLHCVFGSCRVTVPPPA